MLMSPGYHLFIEEEEGGDKTERKGKDRREQGIDRGKKLGVINIKILISYFVLNKIQETKLNTLI